jgi:hypothetical protein
VRVLWPFAAALALGWVATRLWQAPLARGRALVAWLVTVAGGMALRIAVQDRELKGAFVAVTLVFVGVGMIGWRAVVGWRRTRVAAADRT